VQHTYNEKSWRQKKQIFEKYDLIFPKLISDMKAQIEESQRILSKTNAILKKPYT
jgi:hypothetical protein